MRNVYLYPVFDDKASFDDVMSRAAWYFEPWLGEIKGFHVGASFEFTGEIATDARFDPAVSGKVSSLLERAVVHNTAATTNASLARAAKSDAELLLIWRMPEAPAERAQTQALYDAVRARGWLSYVVDKDNEMSHGCNWLWGSITLASREERAKLKADSYAALMRFAAQARAPRAYVLGTGPNLEQAAARDFSDGDCIIANSIIKNRDLMKRLDPIGVCACDPIFHAGVSLYAAEFRQTLIEAMDEYPRMFFFAPHRDEKIYLANMPARLHDRFIFVPIDTDPGTKWNFDLRRAFYLVPEGNVLTQMMLPIAAAFHDKISVIGCDGRPLSQNSYFWSHHKSSQFNDQMQNIQEVHPAFFSLRDYDDHYAEHCADTARIISNIEEAGKRVECLTDSYIPALRARYTLDQKPLGDDLLVVSINPNLRDRYGHLLGYDEGMREAVRAAGGHFLTLGSKMFASGRADLDNTDIVVEPCFSDNVYVALTRALPDVDQNAVLNFEREFEAAVVRHKSEHVGKRVAYYLYMGSLPHAVALANVCARHPEISATVNTFGECIMDCMRGTHIDQWTDFLHSVAQQRNFAVLAITPQLKREVRERCGVDLPLCGHPTGAFSDHFFSRSIEALSRAPISPNAHRLVFPGGFWGEKNFDLTCDIAKAAAGRGYSCAVRTGPLESANRQQLDARRAIQPFARTADGVLSENDYRALFANADIAVLTYRRNEWRIRNSSVVVDCLYSGLPMVVVAGTWLADLVTQYGCGEIVERETATAFMAAVEKIRAQYPLYRQRTIHAAQAYQAANSFADIVSAAISPIWGENGDAFIAYDPRTIPAALNVMRASALGEPLPPPRLPTPPEKPAMPFDNSKIYPDALRFEISRAADCMFEELAVARMLLRDRNQAQCIMIDVGAHSGGSFPPFIDAGWTVHAFEPDPSNRAGIPKRYLENPRFILDQRALSDKVQEDVPFFTSSESTGISTLGAFHATHEETTRVSTTTLAEVVRERGIGHITLLKVDTEGFDLFVLKGMDWNGVTPDVVITEFENNKTERLGYTVDDQIRFLEERGYVVFVSEWWPIVRYGIRHHWRSLYPAADKHPPSDSWGNLIAFKHPPALKDVYEAMLEAVDMPRDNDHLAHASDELAALRASLDRSATPTIAPAPGERAMAEAPALPRARAADWIRARTTPGRKAAVAATLSWVLLTVLLTAAAFWLANTSTVLAPLAGPAAGAAMFAWIGVGAVALAGLTFLKRRGIAERLAREPALIDLLRRANSLQRHRRREAILSARALAVLGLTTGALIGGGAAGVLAPIVWLPATLVCMAVAGAVCGVWALALLLSLVRGESEAVAAARFDRTIALIHSDLSAQARAQDEGAQITDRALADLHEITHRTSARMDDVGARTQETIARTEQTLAATEAEFGRLQRATEAELDRLQRATEAELDRLQRATEVERALVQAEFAAHATDTIARFDRFRRSISELDGDFRGDISQRLADMREDLEFGIRQRANAAKAAALSEGEIAIAALEQRMAAVLEELAGNTLAVSERVVDLAAERSSHLNFGRGLKAESIVELLKWAEVLGLKVESGALAYMSHRISAMETIASGRLAASTETQILRNLVAMSIRKDKLEAMEIGTLYGLGAASLVETLAPHVPIRVTVVDPFAGYYGELRDPLLNLPISRERFETNMRRLGVSADQYRIVQGFSEDDATIAAAAGAYQYLLIDGDHSYEGVRRDFENYAPLVERYGFVLIDDYGNAEYDGIQRFVDETLMADEDLQFVGAAFSTAIFRVWRKKT